MIRAIVTDIEGTTSSISFVKDILFPYASKYLPEFVRNNSSVPDIKTQIDSVKNEIGSEADIDRVIAQLQQWIEEDKKVTPLKTLQGMIWEKGYQNGDYYGHIYKDARDALEHWCELGLKIYVYSSGSVYAQKLLFAHTEFGDLTGLFAGYFDTNIGAKSDENSYSEIIKATQLPANEIVFLSDIESELDAAGNAGMQTIWLVRDAATDKTASHMQVKDFSQIQLDKL